MTPRNAPQKCSRNAHHLSTNDPISIFLRISSTSPKLSLYLCGWVICPCRWALDTRSSTLFPPFHTIFLFYFSFLSFPPVSLSIENSLDMPLHGRVCVTHMNVSCHYLSVIVRIHLKLKEAHIDQVKREGDKRTHGSGNDVTSVMFVTSNMRHVTHVNESCLVWMSHENSLDCLIMVVFVTSMNESCHTCKRGMSHVRMSHVPYGRVVKSCWLFWSWWCSWQVWLSHMSHVQKISWYSHHTCKYVMSRMSESWKPVGLFDHGEVCDKSEWVRSHLRVSHVTHDWVMKPHWIVSSW